MADDAEGDVFDGDDPFDDIEARLSRISDHLDDPFDEQAHPDAPARLASDAGELDRLMDRIRQRARDGFESADKKASAREILPSDLDDDEALGVSETESTPTKSAESDDDVPPVKHRYKPSQIREQLETKPVSEEVDRLELDWLSIDAADPDLLPASRVFSADEAHERDEAEGKSDRIGMLGFTPPEGDHRVGDLWEPLDPGPSTSAPPAVADVERGSAFSDRAAFGLKGTEAGPGAGTTANHRQQSDPIAPVASSTGPQPNQTVLWATGPQSVGMPTDATSARGPQSHIAATPTKPVDRARDSTGLFYTLGGITLIVLSVLLFANMFFSGGDDSGENEETTGNSAAVVELRNCTAESAHVSISNTSDSALLVELRIRFLSGDEIYYDTTTEAGPIAAEETLTTTVLLSANEIPEEYLGKDPEECSVDVVSTTAA